MCFLDSKSTLLEHREIHVVQERRWERKVEIFILFPQSIVPLMEELGIYLVLLKYFKVTWILVKVQILRTAAFPFCMDLVLGMVALFFKTQFCHFKPVYSPHICF